MRKLSWAVVVTLILWPRPAGAGEGALVELTVGTQSFQGRILARSPTRCWLLDRDGQIHEVPLGSVTSYRQVSARFRSFSAAQVRSRLLQEFGRELEVAGTRHYLVAAPPGRARRYADLLEQAYRNYYLYFRTRGFEFRDPEFPLVALVFPDRTEFAEYCRRDRVAVVDGLRGYYLRTSNRIALYDPASARTAARQRPIGAALGQVHTRLPGPRSVPCDSANAWRFSSRGHSRSDGFSQGVASVVSLRILARASRAEPVRGEVYDTLIHEATHQFAFNMGLHSRIGQNPKWVVEGLATVLEVAGPARTKLSRSVRGRINRERFLWFRNYARTRRPDRSLAQFLRNDRMFDTAVLDAYSQAWALSFYLMETRPRRYMDYLKAVARRNPLRAYTPEERVRDFQKAFGENLDRLEADFLRFVDRL